MTTLTKAQVSILRTEINAALAAVAKKHGVDFTLGTIRFNAETMSGKLTGVTRSAGSTTPATPKTVALSGIGKQILGSKFDENATYYSMSLGTVKITGCNLRARSYPFVVTTTGGKSYKITEIAAKRLVAAGPV
jgi:hypothetical protein